ncbi:MAG: hypothetical protein ABI831_10330 [Betaproteobacteria bacterium]
MTTNTAFNCSITKPCRTFSEAIGVTNSGGEVVVLDSAGYGPVTIAQSVSIIAPHGIFAGISVVSGDGITISGRMGDKVVLRGLTINGQGGLSGIKFMSGKARSLIQDNGGAGIDLQGSTTYALLTGNVVRRSDPCLWRAAFPGYDVLGKA